METLLTVGEQEAVELNSHLRRENLDLKHILAQLQDAERAQGLCPFLYFDFLPSLPGLRHFLPVFTVCPFAALAFVDLSACAWDGARTDGRIYAEM